ncbi:hypothetical protein K474DRAFT_1704450 [Panus rudis PR-1116 ss-1]|nr:hypothetical protein K474DRAFT_1704450 [Panus rudis PR-1116 ss-1]
MFTSTPPITYRHDGSRDLQVVAVIAAHVHRNKRKFNARLKDLESEAEEEHMPQLSKCAQESGRFQAYSILDGEDMVLSSSMRIVFVATEEDSDDTSIGEWLAAQMPNARQVYEEGGHLASLFVMDNTWADFMTIDAHLD